MPPEPKYGTNQWFEWQYKGTDPGSDPWGGTIRAGLQLRLDEYAEFIQTQIGEDHFILCNDSWMLVARSVISLHALPLANAQV